MWSMQRTHRRLTAGSLTKVWSYDDPTQHLVAPSNMISKRRRAFKEAKSRHPNLVPSRCNFLNKCSKTASSAVKSQHEPPCRPAQTADRPHAYHVGWLQHFLCTMFYMLEVLLGRALQNNILVFWATLGHNSADFLIKLQLSGKLC